MLLTLVLVPVVCSAGSENAVVWNETDTNCGIVFHFSRSFDKADYEFFGNFIDELPSDVQSVYYRSPHGPQPECSATWSKDMSYETLQKQIASIRRDTYDSFIVRNRYIAEHATNTFTTPTGRKIQIVRKTESGFRSSLILARVGFSSDMRQALICTDSIVYLYELSGDRWKQIGKVVLWIP